MRQDVSLSEFEAQLGAALPHDYREFLVAHTDKLLEPELAFNIPNGPSGIVTYLYTASDLLKLSATKRLGDPARGMMVIGSDQIGGYVYMCVRDSAFGHVYCRVAYRGGDYIELAPSFSAFTAICTPIEEGPDA